jgi:hypothetical protein
MPVFPAAAQVPPSLPIVKVAKVVFVSGLNVMLVANAFEGSNTASAKTGTVLMFEVIVQGGVASHDVKLRLPANPLFPVEMDPFSIERALHVMVSPTVGDVSTKGSKTAAVNASALLPVRLVPPTIHSADADADATALNADATMHTRNTSFALDIVCRISSRITSLAY